MIKQGYSIEVIALLNKKHYFIQMENSVNKTYDFIKNDKFVNKKWKGVISGKTFPLVCSKYLSSWTGLGKSGHVQSQSFGTISRISDRKLSF